MMHYIWLLTVVLGLLNYEPAAAELQEHCRWTLHHEVKSPPQILTVQQHIWRRAIEMISIAHSLIPVIVLQQALSVAVMLDLQWLRHRRQREQRYPNSTTTQRLCSTSVTAASTPLAKRDLPATTAFPSSRLSSACSCILTEIPKPTTIYATTKTVTKAPPACTDVNTIVQNGDFETGSLAPWLVLFSAPNLQDLGSCASVTIFHDHSH